jgi:hypothetical protein
MLLEILAQVEEDSGLILPDSSGAAVVFAVLVAIGVGLWLLVRKTRSRAEDEFWDRKRHEDESNSPE